MSHRSPTGLIIRQEHQADPAPEVHSGLAKKLITAGEGLIFFGIIAYPNFKAVETLVQGEWRNHGLALVAAALIDVSLAAYTWYYFKTHNPQP